jgi:hypothetical protein
VAAARRRNIDEAVALQVVFLADVGALESHRDPVETKASGSAEEQALDSH